MLTLNYFFAYFFYFSYRQLSCASPSGQLKAIVRKVPGNKGKEDKQFLEVSRVWVMLKKFISDQLHVILTFYVLMKFEPDTDCHNLLYTCTLTASQ